MLTKSLSPFILFQTHLYVHIYIYIFFLQGRLEDSVKPSDADILDNIHIVKETLRSCDTNPETGRPLFDPTLQKRGDIRPEKNVYRLVLCSEEESDKRYGKKLRTSFKNKVLNHDFMDSREENKTEL